MNSKFNKGFRKYFFFGLFILPALLVYSVFFLNPFVQGIGYSFISWNGITPEVPRQMKESEFSVLVDYNLPLEMNTKDFDRRFGKYKSQPESIYEMYTINSEGKAYKLNLTDGNYDMTKIAAVYKKLKDDNFKYLLTDKEREKIHSYYENRNGTLTLENKVSVFSESFIKSRLKKVGYSTIKFVGFDNYKDIPKDSKFGEVISFTLFFTLFNVILINLIALLIALALDSSIRNKNLLRTMFFLPTVLSLIIVAYIWSFIYRDVFSYIYNFTGIQIFNLSWLTDTRLAPWAVVVTSVWQGLGYIMVIYLAGLQTIPTDILEVASIDGANGLKKFFSITLPLLFPSITICFFMTLTNSLKGFETMLALTNGGFKTTSFVLNVYFEAFAKNRVGYSTAQAIILLFVIMGISTIQLSIMKKREIEY